MSFIVVVAVALFSSWYGRFCCCCYADCLLASQPAIFCMKAYSGLFCSEVPRFVLYLLSYRGEKQASNTRVSLVVVVAAAASLLDGSNCCCYCCCCLE